MGPPGNITTQSYLHDIVIDRYCLNLSATSKARHCISTAASSTVASLSISVWADAIQPRPSPPKHPILPFHELERFEAQFSLSH
mmetsp:Transcript_31011/g.74945  ORF Transcript_31011/g.74945 Transcript_31011/m.74945 type:complete len:84 (-) Transcript_31011:289-540(-)